MLRNCLTLSERLDPRIAGFRGAVVQICGDQQLHDGGLWRTFPDTERAWRGTKRLEGLDVWMR